MEGYVSLCARFVLVTWLWIPRPGYNLAVLSNKLPPRIRHELTAFIRAHMLPRNRILLVHLVLQMLLPLRQHLQRTTQAQNGVLRAVLFLRRVAAPKATKSPARHLERLLLITGGEESHSRYILRSLEDCLVGLVDRVLLCLAGLVVLPALLLLVLSESYRLESCLLGEFPSLGQVIYADREYSGCL